MNRHHLDRPDMLAEDSTLKMCRQCMRRLYDDYSTTSLTASTSSDEPDCYRQHQVQPLVKHYQKYTSCHLQVSQASQHLYRTRQSSEMPKTKHKSTFRSLDPSAYLILTSATASTLGGPVLKSKSTPLVLCHRVFAYHPAPASKIPPFAGGFSLQSAATSGAT